jgi:hypothetical protein
MTPTSSVLVSACGPVSGTLLNSSSVSSAHGHRRDVAVDDGRRRRAAYGPLTTSPALTCGAHMPKKLVANTVGRRLTHSRPESTAYCSTSCCDRLEPDG